MYRVIDYEENIKNQYNEYSELEVRFGYGNVLKDESGNNYFTHTSNLQYSHYKRLLDELNNKFQSQQTETTDFIKDTYRRTEDIWIQKDKLSINPGIYGYRISLSTEIPIEPIDDFEPLTIRVKYRTSFNVISNNTRIDLTKVEQYRENKFEEIRYEVEMEFLPREITNENLTIFSNEVDRIYKVLYNTEEMYTYIEKENADRNLEKWTLGHKLSQARNLHIQDMVYGGLIGNSNTIYTVTYKVDGLRKLLLIDDVGIWLIQKNKDYNLVMRHTDLDNTAYIGSVLDCEMIIPDSKSNMVSEGKIVCYIFDCQALKTDTNIRYLKHTQQENLNDETRMSSSQEIVNFLTRVSEKSNNKILRVLTKDFKAFETVDSFYEIISKMLQYEKLAPYKTDGLVFTPAGIGYDLFKNKQTLKSRVLTVFPDICKWKRQAELSNDFSLYWNNEVPNLYVLNGKEEVLFTGDLIMPFNQDNIDLKTLKTLESYDDGTVIEFRWDSKNKLMIPMRPRMDKKYPNTITIAKDNWYLANNPITDETLMGKNIVLLRKYHNRIKKALFSSVDRGLILLDIGSGRGGDLSKWRNFKHIFAVEPNSDHLIELRNRLSLYPDLKEKVTIIETGGQDYETISSKIYKTIGTTVDVVSIMLSLSFFWKDSNMLKNLAKTIEASLSPNGKILFLTIDGDTVDNHFQNVLRPRDIVTNEKWGIVTIEYNPEQKIIPGNGKELTINIKDSIVTKQTEYLVYLTDLQLLLPNWKFTPYQANDEKFLSDYESRLTNLYTYGVFSQKSQQDNKKSMIKKYN
jgi:hypothetical protein